MADAESLEDINKREEKCIENAGTDPADLARCAGKSAKCLQIATAEGAANAEVAQGLCGQTYQKCKTAANRNQREEARCNHAYKECFTATGDYTVVGAAAKCAKTGAECAKEAKWNPSKLAKCTKKGITCVEETAAGRCTILGRQCIRASPHDARQVAHCTETAHEETAAFQAKLAEIAKTLNECNAAAADDEAKKIVCAEKADEAKAALAAAGKMDMKTLILIGGGALLVSQEHITHNPNWSPDHLHS